MNKLLFFIISCIGLVPVILVEFFFDYRLCQRGSWICADWIDTVYNVSLFFVILVFFSLATLKMPDHVFKSWWSYARIAIPSTLLLLLYINLGLLHGSTAGSLGWGSFINSAVDLILVSLIYFLFILGSLIQIYRGYIESRGGLIKLFSFLLVLGIAILVALYLLVL